MTASGVRAGLEALSRAVLDSLVLSDRVAAVARRYVETLRRGGRLFFCGNGGSAADAQHIATEYVVRYSATRAPLAAIALTTDTSLLTAAANDFGFEQVFARQVEALCRPERPAGAAQHQRREPNLLAAARAARERQVATVAFLGRGGGAAGGRWWTRRWSCPPTTRAGPRSFTWPWSI